MPKLTIDDNTWVEINDPHTKTIFYANPKTGECSWERPKNSKLQPRNPNEEWWELWDENNQLPYYYHTLTGQTEWVMPNFGTIIPLIKIQNSSIGKRMSAALVLSDVYETNLETEEKNNNNLLNANNNMEIINNASNNYNNNNNNYYPRVYNGNHRRHHYNNSNNNNFLNNNINDDSLYPNSPTKSFMTFESNMTSGTNDTAVVEINLSHYGSNSNNNSSNNNNYGSNYINNHNNNNNNNIIINSNGSSNSNNNDYYYSMSPSYPLTSSSPLDSNPCLEPDHNFSSNNVVTKNEKEKKSFIKKLNKQCNGNGNGSNNNDDDNDNGLSVNNALAATKSILKKASKRSLKSLLQSSSSSFSLPPSSNHSNNNDYRFEELVNSNNINNVNNNNNNNHNSNNNINSHHHHNQMISQSISSIDTSISSSSTLFPSRSMTPTAYLNQLLHPQPIDDDKKLKIIEREKLTLGHLKNIEDDNNYDFGKQLRQELKLDSSDGNGIDNNNNNNHDHYHDNNDSENDDSNNYYNNNGGGGGGGGGEFLDVKEKELQQGQISQHNKRNLQEKNVLFFPAEKSKIAFENAKINGISNPIINHEAAALMKPVTTFDKNNNDGANEKRNEFHFHTRHLSTGEVMTLPPELQNEINQFSIDGFARKFFGTHKKGIFRRRVPLEKMLLFQKDSIKQPLLVLNESVQKDAIKCFRVIQYIMGDRSRSRVNHNNINSNNIGVNGSNGYNNDNNHNSNGNSNGNINGSNGNGNNNGNSKSNLMHIQWLLDRGILLGELRDEIYVQICKQLNNNPHSESIKRGWELLCVITITFPPSKNLESHLKKFMKDNFDRKENGIDVYSKHVYTRLTRICKKGPRGKVLTFGEIERAKEAPFNPSVFGETLSFIMDLQNHVLPDPRLPKILPFLANSILDLRGQFTEGIFRVPGDSDYVTELKLRIEKNRYDITGITDPHVPASLLKLWLRELAEPLIPDYFYDQCIKNSEDKDQTVEIIRQLPDINRKVVTYIVNFLQLFAQPETCNVTKMHVSNLAMIFAPNFLRCPSENLGIILENTKYEQTFMRTLILGLKNDYMNHSDGTNGGYSNNNIDGNVVGYYNSGSTDDDNAGGQDVLKKTYKRLAKDNQSQNDINNNNNQNQNTSQQQQRSSYLQEGTVSGGQHQLS